MENLAEKQDKLFEVARSISSDSSMLADREKIMELMTPHGPPRPSTSSHSSTVGLIISKMRPQIVSPVPSPVTMKSSVDDTVTKEGMCELIEICDPPPLFSASSESHDSKPMQMHPLNRIPGLKLLELTRQTLTEAGIKSDHLTKAILKCVGGMYSTGSCDIKTMTTEIDSKNSSHTPGDTKTVKGHGKSLSAIEITKEIKLEPVIAENAQLFSLESLMTDEFDFEASQSVLTTEEDDVENANMLSAFEMIPNELSEKGLISSEFEVPNEETEMTGLTDTNSKTPLLIRSMDPLSKDQIIAMKSERRTEKDYFNQISSLALPLSHIEEEAPNSLSKDVDEIEPISMNEIMEVAGVFSQDKKTVQNLLSCFDATKKDS